MSCDFHVVSYGQTGGHPLWGQIVPSSSLIHFGRDGYSDNSYTCRGLAFHISFTDFQVPTYGRVAETCTSSERGGVWQAYRWGILPEDIVRLCVEYSSSTLPSMMCWRGIDSWFVFLCGRWVADLLTVLICWPFMLNLTPSNYTDLVSI